LQNALHQLIVYYATKTLAHLAETRSYVFDLDKFISRLKRAAHNNIDSGDQFENMHLISSGL